MSAWKSQMDLAPVWWDARVDALWTIALYHIVFCQGPQRLPLISLTSQRLPDFRLPRQRDMLSTFIVSYIFNKFVLFITTPGALLPSHHWSRFSAGPTERLFSRDSIGLLWYPGLVWLCTYWYCCDLFYITVVYYLLCTVYTGFSAYELSPGDWNNFFPLSH